MKVKGLLKLIILSCFVISITLLLLPSDIGNALVESNYTPSVYTINTQYGPLTFNACEGTGLITLNQNNSKTWYLRGSYPNGDVNPDIVYFNSSIEFLNSTSTKIAEVSIVEEKQIIFSVNDTDLFRNYNTVIRQLNCQTAGEETISYTFDANMLENTRYIKLKTWYSGWWSSSHWSDGNVYTMYFGENYYSSYNPPYVGGNPHTETISFSFNKYPVINIDTPAQNQDYIESDASFSPSITVSDGNNDSLTCKCYLDTESTERDTKTVSNTSSPKTVTFNPINISSLLQGSHIIRFEINDGKGITKKSAAFKVDRSAPLLGKITVSATGTSITINGSARDAITGLDANPYRFTIGSFASSWTSNTSVTQNSLIPNTQYTVKFEARDKKGHINSSFQKVYYTKP